MKLSKETPVDAEEAAENAAEVEAPKPPPIRTVKTRETCRHTLTTEQLVNVGKELAETQREVGQLEDDFKSVRDDWKARISANESRMTQLAGRMMRGYDMKDTECTVYMDTPEAGFKTCLRNDTSEKVWVREMSESDKQLPLPLDDEPVAPRVAEEAPVDPNALQIITDEVNALAKEHGIPPATLLAALVAINGGANSVAKLQREMKLGYTAASKIYEVAKLAGAPEPAAETSNQEGGDQ